MTDPAGLDAALKAAWDEFRDDDGACVPAMVRAVRRAVLLEVAELEAERDDWQRRFDSSQDSNKTLAGMVHDASRAGYDRAVANLRDHERTARFGVDRAISRRAADYLVATKESTP